MTLFVHHFVPPNLEGDILYPLNQLRERNPELAASQLQKYKGRESLTERRIPILDCLWNDVLHLSAVSFRSHKAIFLDEGFELGTWRWFEIPIEKLKAEKTVIYRSQVRPYGDLELRPDEFEPFSPLRLQAVKEEPLGLRAHIRQARSEGRRPLVAAGCPHVLYRGSIDLDGLRIIEE